MGLTPEEKEFEKWYAMNEVLSAQFPTTPPKFHFAISQKSILKTQKIDRCHTDQKKTTCNLV